jgi:hypothetical protein
VGESLVSVVLIVYLVVYVAGAQCISKSSWSYGTWNG